MNWIGIDAHKSSTTIAVMDDNGNVMEMYKVNNDVHLKKIKYKLILYLLIPQRHLDDI
ncbi:MAG: hypothetical protein ACP5TX_02285 [Thermoplasmata archaeon]